MFLTKCAHISVFLLFIAKCNADCSVPIANLKDILPVDTANKNNILYPNDKLGNIVTKNGNSVSLACPGDQIVLKKNKKVTFNVETTTFTCTNNVYVNQQIQYKIDELTCDSLRPFEYHNGQCASANMNVVIGFKYNDNNFIPQIEVCWDNAKKMALYALTKITFVENGCHAQAERPAFRTGNFFEAQLAKYYTKHFQMYNMCTAYNSMPNVITPEVVEKSLIEIGHYVAKCDFPHDAQQRLTFQYTNTGPQWGSFNRENWFVVEKEIRRYIVTQNTDLFAYTGTYGNMKFNNKDYYLYDAKSLIPVPQYFWKVIIKQTGTTYLGVAILGLNDIFATTATDPCTNILPTISWLKIPKAQSFKSGYIIACDVNDFVKIAGLQGRLPNLPAVSGVLK